MLVKGLAVPRFPYFACVCLDYMLFGGETVQWAFRDGELLSAGVSRASAVQLASMKAWWAGGCHATTAFPGQKQPHGAARGEVTSHI